MDDKCVYDFCLLKALTYYLKKFKPKDDDKMSSMMRQINSKVVSDIIASRDLLDYRWFINCYDFAIKIKAFLDTAKSTLFYTQARVFVRIVLNNDDMNLRKYGVSKEDPDLFSKIFGDFALEAKKILGYSGSFDTTRILDYIKYNNILAYDALDRGIWHDINTSNLSSIEPELKSFIHSVIMFARHCCSKEVLDLVKNIKSMLIPPAQY